MNRALALLALAIALGGCPTAKTGTIDLELTAAPGSTLLDSVERLRVTLTNPRQVVEAIRGPDGFALAIDVEATGVPGALVVEGFDAGDALVASGQSPEFGVAAIDSRIVVYLAPPLSVERAPVSLMPARANVSVGPLVFGAVLAGGRDPASMAPSDAIAVYNAFDHSLLGGRPLPAPRDGIVVATGGNNIVYLFGGRDGAGNATGTYWLFDTNVPPSGAYIDLGDHPGFARADEVAVPIGVDHFIITGTPPIETRGTSVVERAGAPALVAAAASIVAVNGTRTALVLDATGKLVRFRGDTVDTLATAARPGASLAALPDGRFLVVGGGTADEQNDVVVVDPDTGIDNVLADTLAEPHAGASVAVTRRHVVIAGGGASTEILDAATLARLAVTGALAGPAIALPNDQVLITGSEGDLSLFTPPPGV